MNHPNLVFTLARETDYPAVVTLVRQVFDATVGKSYSQQGRDEFYKYIDLDAFTERQRQNCFTLVAKDADQIVGILEMRDYQHISLFFVDQNYQHQGIGKHLLADGIARCKTVNPALDEISVHSAVTSCPVYLGLGFIPQGGEQNVNGIRFQTMHLAIQEGHHVQKN